MSEDFEQPNNQPLAKIWSDFRWRDIFSLLGLSWVKPFLTHLDLPQAFLENTELWGKIAKKAIEDYYITRQSQHWLLVTQIQAPELILQNRTVAELQERNYYEALLTRQMVSQALQALAKELGLEVSQELERWIHFHIFNHEASVALRQWTIVLRYAFPPNLEKIPPGRQPRMRVPVPDLLLPVLPEIHDWICFEQREAIEAQIKAVAPPPPYPQIPYEQLDQCFEATLLATIINQSLTFRALRRIVQQTGDLGAEMVASWASEQCLAMSPRYGPRQVANLYQAKFLRHDLPEIETQSVLEDLC